MKRWPGTWDRCQICKVVYAIFKCRLEIEGNYPPRRVLLRLPSSASLAGNVTAQLACRSPKHTLMNVITSLHALRRVSHYTKHLGPDLLVPSIWSQGLNYYYSPCPSGTSMSRASHEPDDDLLFHITTPLVSTLSQDVSISMFP